MAQGVWNLFACHLGGSSKGYTLGNPWLGTSGNGVARVNKCRPLQGGDVKRRFVGLLASISVAEAPRHLCPFLTLVATVVATRYTCAPSQARLNPDIEALEVKGRWQTLVCQNNIAAWFGVICEVVVSSTQGCPPHTQTTSLVLHAPCLQLQPASFSPHLAL